MTLTLALMQVPAYLEAWRLDVASKMDKQISEIALRMEAHAEEIDKRVVTLEASESPLP